MSLVAVFVVSVCATLDVVAIWLLVRGVKETSAVRIRAISRRARILAALACLLCLIAPVASVALSFNAIESVAPDQRATALAEGISAAMNSAMLGAIVAVPTFIIAIVLTRRSRAMRDAGASTSRDNVRIHDS